MKAAGAPENAPKPLLSLVAGAGHPQCYMVPETYWLDLR